MDIFLFFSIKGDKSKKIVKKGNATSN